MSKLIIIAVLVLAVIAIAQLARLYELTRALRGQREEEISLANNKLNGSLWMVFMLMFYGFYAWLVYAYGDKLLPVSASEHGIAVDALMNFNLWLVTAIFLVTNTLLFFFAFKYYHRPDRKASFYPENHKLELLWTVIPTIVLAVVIIFGLNTWIEITGESKEKDGLTMEIYSKQFDWTARYPGDDNKLGKASFNFISTNNALGLINDESYSQKVAEIDAEIAEVELKLKDVVMSDVNEEAAQVKLRRLKSQRIRITSASYDKADFAFANDDKIVKGEFHIPIGKEVNFLFRSQDVIHSAYMPHFRAQMNTVPGMVTQFRFKPIITTDSMRVITGKKDFNYILLCNKVCGAAHNNMQMTIIVESEADYKKWLAGQKTFAETVKKEEEVPAVAEPVSTVIASNNIK